jgi:hypothetical protein
VVEHVTARGIAPRRGAAMGVAPTGAGGGPARHQHLADRGRPDRRTVGRLDDLGLYRQLRLVPEPTA